MAFQSKQISPFRKGKKKKKSFLFWETRSYIMAKLWVEITYKFFSLYATQEKKKKKEEETMLEIL